MTFLSPGWSQSVVNVAKFFPLFFALLRVVAVVVVACVTMCTTAATTTKTTTNTRVSTTVGENPNPSQTKRAKKKASRGGVCNALWRPSAVWRGGGCLFGSGERGERGSVGGLGGPVALLTDCQCVHVWVSVFFNARQHFCNSNNGNTTRRKILKSINKIFNK